MNVNELKIGDIVRFKWRDEDYLTYIGFIDQINTKPEIFYIKTDKEYNKGLWGYVEPQNILSKLEPLPPQYKEIKIEHKKEYQCDDDKCFCHLDSYIKWADRKMNESSIKVSDLKIDDKVKYFNTSGQIQIGTIRTITKTWITFKESGSWDSRPDLVICKLEQKNPLEYPPIYKEIPIEKEEDKKVKVICKCGRYDYVYEVFAQYWECPECKSNTCKMIEKEEKSAPKSLKCELDIFSYYFTSRTDQSGKITLDYYNLKIKNNNLSFCIGKTYTIEIKEKE